MKLKDNISNIIFVGLIIIMLIPTSRNWFLKNVVSRLPFSASTITSEEQKTFTSYNWKLQDLDEKTLDFSELKGQKVLLVNFWATWCPPCVAEMPSLQRLYEDYENKIQFVFVSNEDKTKIETFLKRKGFTMPVYNRYNDMPSEFDVSKIPTTFIISKRGKIVVQETGITDWNSTKTRVIIDKLIEE